MNEEWISVKDELPEEEDDYLVAWMSDKLGGYQGSNKCFIGICEFVDGKFYTGNLDRLEKSKVTVYAWMPLPELYEI